MRRLCTLDEFAKLSEAQQRDSETSVTTISVNQPEFTADGRGATFIFNNESVGRDGHIVLNRGIQTDNYERNPTILWAHDDSMLPIGRASALRIGEPVSKVDIEFTPRDLNPFGAMVGELVRAKFLNACSMSWMPLKWKLSTDKNRAGGVDFTEVDLLEISIVPIPALPGAIATARANGIDTQPMVEWAERLLDKSDMTLVPRNELEILRRSAKMPPSNPAAVTTLAAKHARALARAPKVPVFKRGLYGVAQLCELLCTLGYCHESAEYEADLEQDDSQVPAMLGDALMKLGEALKAMATEEVDELLALHGDDDGEAAELETRALSAEQRAHIAAGKTPRARAWRAGVIIARAGKSLSASNQDKLEDAQGHHERAMKHSRALKEHQDAVSGHLKDARSAQGDAADAHAETGQHIAAAQSEPANAPDHLKRAVKSHAEAEKHMGAVADAHDDIADRHADASDSHGGMERSVKSAARCVRTVVSGAVTSEADEPGANATQTSEAAKEEKARAARVARAATIAQQHKEPTTLD